MANREHVKILKKGVEFWNKWRKEHIHAKINLRYANLTSIDLRSVNLQEADLFGANFTGVDFTQANLKRALALTTNFQLANLKSADLKNSELWSANLQNVNLSRADLRGSNLNLANLGGANLTKSNLTNAWVGSTKFANSDLSETIGLDYVFHSGPSTIGTNAIEKSKGKISEAFLRGCGLSNWEIESAKLYNPELSNEEVNKTLYKMHDLRIGQAIQISSLFISYSHRDSLFVNKLEGYLNEKGIRFWRDVHDMKSGRIETQIDTAIRQNPTVLLILSENSLKSDWVEHEVRTARGVEKDVGRDVLCPVALDYGWQKSTWPKRVMEQITEYNILDFSAWEDNIKFKNTFNKLVDGLQLFYKSK